jgi:hypothetical protein
MRAQARSEVIDQVRRQLLGAAAMGLAAAAAASLLPKLGRRSFRYLKAGIV